MEFLEEETRPRFQLQSYVPASESQQEFHQINKPQVAIFVLIASLLSISAFFVSLSPVLQFFLLWFAVSLFIGPFAPISVTGGDVRVGRGELLQEPDPDESKLEEPKKKSSIRRTKPKKSDDSSSNSLSFKEPRSETEKNNVKVAVNGEGIAKEEKEWIDEDFEVLKKQISKHPPGEPGRWELITEAFNGRHGLESVIRTAKSLSEKKPGGENSFDQFLKQRKPLNKQFESANGETETSKESEGLIWSHGEDMALLNALKAFPKDVPLRWEKIAASIPGKSKATCMRRLQELKRDFRSSKASDT